MTIEDLFSQAGIENARAFEEAEHARPVKPRGRHAAPQDRPVRVRVAQGSEGSKLPERATLQEPEQSATAAQRVHLYDAMGYEPRVQFAGYHKRTQRHACLVCHRRAGKTVAAIADLIREAMRCELDAPRCGYIAPFYRQARAIAWDYLQAQARGLPGYKANQSTLSVEFTAQDGIARVSLYGADNPDSLRGLYFDAIVLDEPAQISARLFPQIIRPALADRGGRSTFVGTPAGRNAFFDVWEHAQADDDWFALNLRADTSGILSIEEMKALKKEMSPASWMQEFLTDFGAAVEGAYYGREIADAWQGGRITSVPVDPSLPVHVVMDLGYADLNSVWMFQVAGTEIHLVEHLDYQFRALPEIINDIKTRYKDQALGAWVAPHDIRVRELGSGRSRLGIAAEHGVAFEVAPNVSIDEGIERARVMLPRCWFDKDKAADGVLHLEQYRAEYDEKKNRLKPTPRHDEHSHAADAFRYLALSGIAERGNWAVMSDAGEELDYSQSDRGVI